MNFEAIVSQSKWKDDVSKSLCSGLFQQAAYLIGVDIWNELMNLDGRVVGRHVFKSRKTVGLSG